MMHFDFQVGDLDSAVAEAVAIGASVATEQPQDNVRVLFDPAGHPSASAETTADHPAERAGFRGPLEWQAWTWRPRSPS
jgi:Glyoxalase-like domain